MTGREREHWGFLVMQLTFLHTQLVERVTKEYVRHVIVVGSWGT